MGLRCLLGHDFDEPEVEREREEGDSEVVTTVREVKTCSRCGETQIVSENTEVTTMERLTEAATADGSAHERGKPRTGASPESQGATSPRAEDETTAGDGTTAVGSGGTGFTPTDGADEEYSAPTDGEDAEIIDAGPNDGAGATAEAPSDGATDESSSTGRTDAAPAGSDAGSTAEDEDAEVIGGGESGTWPDERASGASTERGTGVEDGAGSGADPEGKPAPDDGVILDDDGEAASPERERGAWPERNMEDESTAEPTPWPEQQREDEGWNATVSEADDDEETGVAFGGGLTPEATDESAAEEDVEFVEAPDRDAEAVDDRPDEGETDEFAGSGITREDGTELQTVGGNVETEYYCPECRMTRAAEGNSMRAGDICPECKRGYVNERAR